EVDHARSCPTPALGDPLPKGSLKNAPLACGQQACCAGSPPRSREVVSFFHPGVSNMSEERMRSGRRGRSAARSPRGGEEGGAGPRPARLSRRLREELDALVRDELTDPRLDGVTVTFVELSVDYKNARIGFVGPDKGAASDERDRMARALVRATPFL